MPQIDYGREDWVWINSSTQRLLVPGGWLYVVYKDGVRSHVEFVKDSGAYYHRSVTIETPRVTRDSPSLSAIIAMGAGLIWTFIMGLQHPEMHAWDFLVTLVATTVGVYFGTLIGRFFLYWMSGLKKGDADGEDEQNGKGQ